MLLEKPAEVNKPVGEAKKLSVNIVNSNQWVILNVFNLLRKLFIYLLQFRKIILLTPRLDSSYIGISSVEFNLFVIGLCSLVVFSLNI